MEEIIIVLVVFILIALLIAVCAGCLFAVYYPIYLVIKYLAIFIYNNPIVSILSITAIVVTIYICNTILQLKNVRTVNKKQTM